MKMRLPDIGHPDQIDQAEDPNQLIVLIDHGQGMEKILQENACRDAELHFRLSVFPLMRSEGGILFATSAT